MSVDTPDYPPDGPDDPYLDAPFTQVLQRHKVRLKPLIYELKVLTKRRGLARLGDVIKPAQEDFLDEVERQINENGQVRIIVLKARQMGISTIIEAILFVLSLLYENYQSLIISHESESAEHILGMTKRYWETYPFRDYHVEKYSARKQLSWSDLESNLVIATAKNTGAGRSKTLHALHASEVAFWDKPEELVTGLRQAIPSFGLTAMFYESTANGIGNFFHQTWIDAEGDSEFKPKFYPWFWEPEYTSAYIPGHEQHKYSILENLTEDEIILRSMGLSAERLLWRRWAIVNLCFNDVDKFKQEYPSTATEAFLTTGRNVFRLPDLMRHYEPMKPFIGYLKKSPQGVVEFTEHHRGPLKIYRKPSADMNWGVYQCGADPTHTTVGDAACGQVINRRTLEQVAVFRKHMDPTSFGREMALLGEYYNLCQIAPEKEGPGYATVGYLVGIGYPNIYEAQKVDKTPGKVNHDVFGWGTNATTKHLAISRLVDLLGQPVQVVGGSSYGLVIHDEDTFNEMKNYVVDEKGYYMNGNGTKFDDTVMALGISVTTHFIEPALAPYSRDTTVQDAGRQVLTKLPQGRTGNQPPVGQDKMVDINQLDEPVWGLE